MKIFITRDINAHTSIFYKELTKFNFEVSGQSLIRLSLIPFKHIPVTDWIFFYSKNAIQFFFDHIQTQQISFHSSTRKWATIGEGSAKKLLKFGIKADFIGNGEPNITAKSFLQIAENQHVLFPRAKQSKQSIQALLQKNIYVHDLIIYNNQPQKMTTQRFDDILVFTSPMNVTTYFNAYPKLPHQQLIAIGNTTAKALYTFGFMEVIIAEAPSEASLVKAVLSIVAGQKAS